MPVELEPSFEKAFMAVERVEKLLRRTTEALNAAKVPYAVVGGNAVAAWVASVDSGAVRNTKDVDILLRRADLDAATSALAAVDLVRDEAMGITVFLTRDDPRPSQGVHVLFAEEPVGAKDPARLPGLSGAVMSDGGYWVIDLPSLVEMKLRAFRSRDQTHLIDMMTLKLIEAGSKAQMPIELHARFQQVWEQYERETGGERNS
ncbi:hypothetical protein RAS1_24950 [Phycisphaerae bacterium RAS1]|nr:hypothetical protein RAS1_24950 [Phycisphaerae bacterium RAS1]